MAAPDPDAVAAWRAGVAANTLCVVGVLFGMIGFRAPLGSTLTAVRCLEIAFSAAWLIALFAGRQRPRLRLSLAAYGLSVLPHLAMTWVLGVAREAGGHGWEPLFRQKVLAILFGAIGAGQSWASLAVIASIAIDVCLEYWVGGLRLSAHLGFDEPWLTLAVCVAGASLAVANGRQFTRERALVERLRDAAASQRLAEVAMAVRDLANTPLQVIEVDLALLALHHPEAHADLRRIHRALERLRKLRELLGGYEPPGGWSHHDESFDAVEVLRLRL